jgi:peptide/nickel transport system substrate-binding protein
LSRTRTIAVVLVLLTACPGPAATPSKTPTPSSPVVGVHGGTLKVSLADDVDAIDPQRAGAPASFGLARAMHRGLMAFPAAAGAEGSRPVPDLADGPPVVSPDGTRYTFTLRSGARFGAPASRPLAAADVKAGLERIFTAHSPFAGYFRVIAGAEAFIAKRTADLRGVAATDAHTVTITLARPVNDLLWLLALPAASAVPPGLPPFAKPTEISASGPYRLAGDGYVPERSIHLVRNEAWSELTDPVRHAYVDQIRFDIGRSPAEIARSIAAGTSDLAGDAIPPGTPTAAIPADRVVREPHGCLRYLFMNTRLAPFGSSRVRAGVAAALDRAAVAATYGPSVADAATTILPPTVFGHDAAAAAQPADLNAARALLGGKGFSTRLVVGDTTLDLDQAAVIRTALRRAGIRVRVTSVAIASVYEDYYEVPAAAVPMGIATWCADWPGLGGRGALAPLVDARTLSTRGNTNYAGLRDPRIVRAIDAASQADPDRAEAAWLAADRRATSTAAVVPLAFPAEIALLGPRVRGFFPHPFFVRGDLTAVWIGTS